MVGQRRQSDLEMVLVGKTEVHVCARRDSDQLGARIHQEARASFLHLQGDAREEGFDLRILSGFRSFEHQLSIWNRKARGELAVLDGAAVPLDLPSLSEEDLVFAILRWSALPGASRHHWGTDVDVYDAAATPPEYQIELIPEEVNAGGMFGPLHEWLDTRIDTGESYGFVRPYDVDRHGVAPERWHLSYVPVAAACLRELTVDLLRETIASADLRLKDTVLLHLDEIHERFITNVNPSAK
jgi:LAS superfamily LD-carboxypeptidase LdcB